MAARRSTHSAIARRWASALLAAAAVFAMAGPAAPAADAAPCANPSGSLDGSFASPATSGAIVTDEVDCYTLEHLAAGDRIRIDLELSGEGTAGWRVLDGSGSQICASGSGSFCAITGTSGWSLDIHAAYYTEGVAFSYSVVARRLTDPEGCAPLGSPATWSFDAGRTDGSIESPLGARCYTFSRAAGEADGSYWFRAVRTAGAHNPLWSLFGPTGSRECSGYSGGMENRCRLLAFGEFALVVDGSGPGSFLLTARRLNAPSGCADAPPVAIGAAPISGSISTAGETDCRALGEVAAGDSITLGFTTPTGVDQSPRVSVIDGAGNPVCETYGSLGPFTPCELTGTPGWSLVTYDYGGAGTFAYSLAVRRLTDPEGCTPLGAPETWSFSAPRLNGSIGGTLAARCYTFSRELGEEDGGYWFRTARSAGTLNPYWAVYGPSGTKECDGSNSAVNDDCRLLASGQYVFFVSDNAGDKTGSFIATARRLTDPAGCPTLPSTAFGAAPLSGDLSSGGSIDCYALPGVAAGSTVAIDFLPSQGGSPRWTVIDANGSPICESYNYYSGYPCALQGAADWSLLVYDTDSGSFSYSLSARRLTDPQGCIPLGDPAAWSFTAPRINGTIDGSLASRCYTFTRSIDDPDGTYWFRTVRTSGALNPNWYLYGPTGQRECHGGNESPQVPCRLQAAGKFSLLVKDGNGTQTGTYFATAKRLNAPEGCTEISSIAFGIAPISGNLSTGGEVDCYRLNASAGDILNFTGTGSADSFALLDPDGDAQCVWLNSPCTISEDGQRTLLVYSWNGATTGSYRFQGVCENVPCGQSNTAVSDVTPNRVGPGEFTSVLLRGRDLELLESAKLVRNGVTVAGELQDPAADGRAIEVRYDLEGAALGSWELQASFLDGTTRNLPAAVTVEPLRPPRVSVELIGREAFRAGRPSAITVSVHNSGNVDGMVVPLVLSGIPAGSVVEPLFEMRRPIGPVSSPTYEAAPFQQETDALSLDSGIAVPMYLPRVPAGRTMQLEYRITAPTQGASYTLRAVAGQCLGTTRAGSAANLGAVSRGLLDTLSCFQAATQQIIGLFPGGSCINTALNLETAFERAVFYPMLGIDEPVGMADQVSYGLDAVGCGLDLTGVGGVISAVVEIGGFAAGGFQVHDACLAPQSESELPQRSVAAIDPNEIIGPAGVGEQRYVPGDQPFDYRVLFENLPTASAPAQRVAIENQLDVANLDPASVLFHDIRFGSTVYSLPYASHEIDDTIDLRPQQNLLVEVEASVSSGGLIEVTLQALDPDTLEPPEDPLAGFLPPNANAPEGEGQFSYSVTPKALASGTVVSNQASIIFDENAPIETPTWTNTIDRLPPTAAVTVDGTSDPAAAEVSWSGGDDAAGVALYEVRVSKDGGPFTLWTASPEPGTETFVATQPGSYSFRVVARDGADNVGQSALAGASLAPAGPPPADPGPGEQPQPQPQPQPAGAAPAAPAPAAAAAPTDGPSSCSAAALRAFQKASRAARGKQGKARAKALKAARKQKAKRLALCKAGS